MGMLLTEAERRERLERAADRLGGKAALGRRLGYKDGAFVGQMIRGDRPITEKTLSGLLLIREVADLFAWFAGPLPGSSASGFVMSSNDEEGRGAQSAQTPIAHLVSLDAYTVPRTKTKEDLQGDQVDKDQFGWLVEDDAIEGYVAGWTAIIDPTRTPKVGSVILVRLTGGDVKLRRYAEGLSGWQARADREGYVTLPGADVTLLGTSRGVLDMQD